MEMNELLYNAFTFYGPLAFSAYLKEREERINGDEMKTLIVNCLPKEFNERFPPLLKKFAHFVGKKANFLFLSKEKTDEFPSFTDTYLLVPSLEKFMNLSKKERLGLFFKSVRKDDIIVAKIVQKVESRYFAEVICFASKKHRVIDDLHFRVILDCDKDMEIGTLIRATFLKTSIKERQIFISIDDKDLPKESNPDSLKLGIIAEDELPLHYRREKEYAGRPCSEVLKRITLKSSDFNLNFDIPSYTLLASEFKISPEKTASYIYEKQMSDLSNYNYRQGVTCFFNNQKTEALKYYNESLKLNPKNIDALLSCGTLFMNRKDYKNAIEMFEKVLQLKESHERAKQFLCSSLEKLIQTFDENEYIEIFKASEKLLQYNPNHEFAEKCFLKTVFHALFSDELGLPWFKGGKYVKVVEDYPSSGSDMEIEETEDGKIEVQVPETDGRVSTLPTKENALSSTSPEVEEKNETNAPSVQKLEVNVDEETPKPLEPDLHKIKCDEFISSNLKKRSISRHSIDSRSVKKVKHSKRHRSHSKHHRRHKKRPKEKHHKRRHSRSSSSHREEDNLTDNLSDISSDSDICDRPKKDPCGPSPPPSSSRVTRIFQRDIQRSESQEHSRSPPRSRTVHLRTRKHSDSSDQQDRSRSRSRHSGSHSPIRYLDEYVPSYPPVPIEPVPRASYSFLAKNSAVKILENILADSKK